MPVDRIITVSITSTTRNQYGIAVETTEDFDRVGYADRPDPRRDRPGKRRP